METYTVTIRRCSYIEIDIEAENIDKAEEMALKEAMETYGDESTANYEIIE